MRKIASLDLSSNTGWACGYPDGEPLFGTWRLPSTGEDVGRFAAAFDVCLNDFIAVESPDLLGFEAPILSAGKTSIDTARKLMGLAWHTEFVCRRRGIPCREGNLMTIKKFFAGSGHASKDDMVRRAYQLGWKVKNDNEADSLGLWSWLVHLDYPDHARRFAPGFLTGVA